LVLLAAFALPACSWYESHSSVKITTWVYERPEAGVDGGALSDAGDAVTDDPTDDAQVGSVDSGAAPAAPVDAAAPSASSDAAADAGAGPLLDGAPDDSGATGAVPGAPEAGVAVADSGAPAGNPDASVDAGASSDASRLQ
jgi:hypothetical protein